MVVLVGVDGVFSEDFPAGAVDDDGFWSAGEDADLFAFVFAAYA
ncbi:hypothetical protein U6G28_09485 [Actinomycetaceae bacterium MB13-C1-2]|nr:hypothetical protein U6G28_09485 [Actinomycetaceae bacterium MB13-C1-2]